MNKKLFYGIVAIQILFLLGMIAFKQSTLLFGTPVLLKPVPVDPTDLFRGDFVNIDYEIATIKESDIAINAQRGDKIFVKLKQSDNQEWIIDSIHDSKPQNPFLRGIVQDVYNTNTYTIEETETSTIFEYEERHFEARPIDRPQVNDQVEFNTFNDEVSFIHKCEDECPTIKDDFSKMRTGTITDIKQSETTYEISYPIQSFFVQRDTGTRPELMNASDLLVEVYLWNGDAVVTRILHKRQELEFK